MQAEPAGAGEAPTVEVVEFGPARGGQSRRSVFVIWSLLAVGFGSIVMLGRPIPTPRPADLPSPTGQVAVEPSLAPPTPTNEPTSRPLPTVRPTAVPGPWVWEPYVVAGFSPETELRRIWGLEDRFVALIATPTDDGDELHSLLISTDGSAWERAVLPAPGFRVERGAVIFGDLWVVGHVASEAGPVRQLWHTPDGVIWLVEKTVGPAFEGADTVDGVMFASSGFVVVIETQPPDGLRELQIRHSVDGVTWTTADLVLTLEGEREVVAVATNGTTYVIAIQYLDPGPGRGVDVVVSLNGIDWTRGPVVQDEVWAKDIAFGAAGYVIVGEDEVGEPRGWHSGDGWSGSWDEVGMPIGQLPPDLGPVGGFRVIPTHRGYLAISEANGMAWTSGDGVEWSAFNVWPSVNEFMTSVAVVGDIIVAGRDSSGSLGFLRGNVSGMFRPLTGP